MKNIHLIPTDKPSRLFLNKVNNKLLLDGDTYSNLEKILPSSNYQHLYITGEEEIKEGDWFIENNKLGKCTNGLWAKRGASILTKKIILTTDQSLEGLQSIDDEFLEWFVKNPTCDYVETKLVEFEVDLGLGDSCVEHGSYYKINTPDQSLYTELVYESNPYTSTIGSESQPNTITFSLKNNEPVIVLDEVGFKYKGELIEDGGEIYELFKDYIRGSVGYTEEQLKLAYMQGYNRGELGAHPDMESYIEFLKETKKD
jgi:hypothetical protein